MEHETQAEEEAGKREGMTLNEFLQKYNRCPFCRTYAIQGSWCYGCKWRWGHGQWAKETDVDMFDPTEEWGRRLNKEVTE